MYGTLTHAAILLYLAAIALSASRFFSGKPKAMGWSAAAMAGAGAAAHLAALVLRGLEKGRFPAATMGEALLLVSFFVVLIYLILYIFYKAHWFSFFVLPAAAVMLLVPLHMPLPEQSAVDFHHPLFASHTALVLLAAAFLLGHAVMSMLYIWQEHALKARRIFLAGHLSPPLDVCDRMGTRLLGLGFVCLTLGILTGALWAARARGNFFAWKFPEIFALLAWLLFGALLELRLARGVRGRAAALLSLAGLLTLAAVFVGVALT
jgi:ABC-type transport system involved in cytochrome c biogenesis permease subunit